MIYFCRACGHHFTQDDIDNGRCLNLDAGGSGNPCYSLISEPAAVYDRFNAHLQAFVEIVQNKINENYKKFSPNIHAPTITIDPRGKKYLRIVRNENNHNCYPKQSVWGFVDVKTGDILKADGWKKPAKHSRGSIYNEDPWKGMGIYGPNYIGAAAAYNGPQQ